VHDGCDVRSGTSDDCNSNSIPDECELSLLQPSSANNCTLNPGPFLIGDPTDTAQRLFLRFAEPRPSLEFIPKDDAGNWQESFRGLAPFIALQEEDESGQILRQFDMLVEPYVLLRNLKRDDASKIELTFLALPTTGYGKHAVSFALYLQDTTLTPSGINFNVAQYTAKWTLKVQTWPFFKLNNVLRLITRLYSNDSSIISITDDIAEANVQRLRFETANTFLTLGVVDSIALDTTDIQPMVAAYGKELGRGTDTLSFLIPQFNKTAVYDPSLGVVIQGDEDAERADGVGDGKAVAIGVGIAVPLAVIVPVVVIAAALGILTYKKRAKIAALQSRMSRVNSFDASSISPN